MDETPTMEIPEGEEITGHVFEVDETGAYTPVAVITSSIDENKITPETVLTVRMEDTGEDENQTQEVAEIQPQDSQESIYTVENFVSSGVCILVFVGFAILGAIVARTFIKSLER